MHFKVELARSLIKWGTFLLLMVLGWITYENVIVRPFPFVIMNYVKSVQEFNQPPYPLIRGNIDIWLFSA